jgi:hypothetical protein
MNHRILISIIPYSNLRWDNEANRWELVIANGFPYNSVKLVSLANGKSYDIDANPHL